MPDGGIASIFDCFSSKKRLNINQYKIVFSLQVMLV
jgi:hypothetical protein